MRRKPRAQSNCSCNDLRHDLDCGRVGPESRWDISLQFHFISGLPRSGSTLLAAVLLQNPRFRAGMSSPVGRCCRPSWGTFAAGSEFGPVIEHEQRQRLFARPVFKLLRRPV